VRKGGHCVGVWLRLKIDPNPEFQKNQLSMPFVRYLSRAIFEAKPTDVNPLDTVVISIGDPGSSMPSACLEFFSCLRLEFLDIDYAQGCGLSTLFERFCLRSWLISLNRLYPGFSREMAVQIRHFVQKHPQKNILVHCDYGKSRSIAVARWISTRQERVLVHDIFPQRPGNLWCAALMRY
jgi:predicted protein tyrosine phosphatase